MRALISLIAGGMLLNLSAQAMAAARESNSSEDLKTIDDTEDESLENITLEKSRGFEMHPRDYENQFEN